MVRIEVRLLIAGLKYKLVCCFKLAADMVGAGIREFVNDMD